MMQGVSKHVWIVGFAVVLGIAGMIDHHGTLLQGSVAIVFWLVIFYGAWGAYKWFNRGSNNDR